VTVRSATAELVSEREILPGQWSLTFLAPDIARAARAGQLVHVRTDDGYGMIRRDPMPLSTVDTASGTVSVHIADDHSRSRRDLGAGDPVDVLGPMGRPFEVDPRSRHILLVAAGLGMAGLRMLADEAVRDGRGVTLLFGTGSSLDVYPSSLLPDEVEYVVATEDGSLGHHGAVTDLVTSYEAWADQAFAAGPWDMLAEVARLAAGRRDRLGVAKLGRKRGAGKVASPGSPAARRKSFLQVAIDQTVGCASGTCLGCVVPGVSGAPLRGCREGPVFAAEEIDWSSGS
jgi:dihydroorotate dehydrogenase electron transfer subunit